MEFMAAEIAEQEVARTTYKLARLDVKRLFDDPHAPGKSHVGTSGFVQKRIMLHDPSSVDTVMKWICTEISAARQLLALKTRGGRREIHLLALALWCHRGRHRSVGGAEFASVALESGVVSDLAVFQVRHISLNNHPERMCRCRSCLRECNCGSCRDCMDLAWVRARAIQALSQVDIYIYIYIHTHTYIYIYICICTYIYI